MSRLLRTRRKLGLVARLAADAPEPTAGMHAFNVMAERVGTLVESLQASEAKSRQLAAIVEQSSDSIMTRDLNGIITSWNRGAERLFGWTAEEAVGKNGRELHLRGANEEDYARMLARMRAPGNWTLEGARTTKSGATVQVSVTLAPLLDECGHVVGEVGIGRDITALKQAEQALLLANEQLETRVHERTTELSRNEALLRGVMDAMPGVVAFQDAQQCYQLCNRRMEELLALDAGAICGKKLSDVMSQENLRVFLPHLQRAQAGETVRFEWHYRLRDGSFSDVDTTLVPVQLPGTAGAGVASFSMDVGRRRRAEATLRESEARNRVLATMVDQSSDAILARDLDGNITYWNNGAAHLHGYSPQEAIGQPLRSLHLRHLSDQELAVVLARIRSGQATAFEVRRQSRASVSIDLAMNMTPLFDEEDGLVGAVVVQRDVTARMNVERKLRHAAAAAEAANRAKSEFLANMSHEIRTPLNGVLGLTEVVLGTELTREQRADLELVQASGRSLMTIINDVLDLSKIEAGHLQIEAIAFAPADTIADALRLLGPRAREKGLALSCTAPGLPPQLVGDPGRLRQIVMNLVGNAIKFTACGEVAVHVAAVPQDCGAHDSTVLQLSVRDSGIGIAPDKHASIFDAFTQADTSTTRRYGGTGLGLSISAKLARLMGGSISVRSTLGEGSTFTVEVRCGVPSAQPISTPSRAGGPLPSTTRHGLGEARRGASILVAEDNEINQLLATRVLQRLGHRVHLANDGQQALDALARQAFDLVLMDMQMPVMGGLEAAATIRSREAGAQTRVPIIALTANALHADRDACLAAGMDDHLTKPYSAAQIEAVLERWLPGARVGTAAERAGRDDDPALLDLRACAPESSPLRCGAQPHADVPACPSPALDIDILKGFIGDDDEAVDEFLRSYLAQAAEAAAALHEARRARHCGTIHRVGHSLKSTARTVGAIAVGEVCAQLEMAGQRGDWVAIDGAMAHLDALLGAAAADAGAWLAARAIRTGMAAPLEP